MPACGGLLRGNVIFTRKRLISPDINIKKHEKEAGTWWQPKDQQPPTNPSVDPISLERTSIRNSMFVSHSGK